MARVAEVAAVISALGLDLGPLDWQPTDGTVSPVTPWITVAALGTFVSLALLGVRVRRVKALPGWRRNVPLLIGVGAFPVSCSDVRKGFRGRG